MAYLEIARQRGHTMDPMTDLTASFGLWGTHMHAHSLRLSTTVSSRRSIDRPDWNNGRTLHAGAWHGNL